MDVLPVSSLAFEEDTGGEGTSVHGGEWRSLLARHDRSEWCILALDVRNTYGLAFEVRMSCDDGGVFSHFVWSIGTDFNIQVTSCRVIPPGLTYR